MTGVFDYLTRLSLEADVSDRKLKREGRSKAYWLGHNMGRFRDGVSTCKTCDMTITLTVDGVRGDAVEKNCTQQLFSEVVNGQEKGNAPAASFL